MIDLFIGVYIPSLQYVIGPIQVVYRLLPRVTANYAIRYSVVITTLLIVNLQLEIIQLQVIPSGP